MIKRDIKNQKTGKRPPVVVVLGHIDHGKTSLLMAVKDFNILSRESGGITQHVGAYQIEFNGEKITFIDTPGHESFSAIRSRGARVADIAVLVIDACEGIKQQTKEAIEIIKEFGVSVIVALNKIDKPEANPEKVKQELSQYDIWVESLGGKTPCVEVSAKTKKGIDDLLETILLLSEVEGIEADFEGNGEGVIIESKLDEKKGPLATMIVINGRIKENDFIGTDSTSGKIRLLENFEGKKIKEVFPSDPAVVYGFTDVPFVGEMCKVYASQTEAEKQIKPKKERSFDLELKEIGDRKVLNLVLKADVLGSLEANLEVLKNLPQDKVVLNIVKADVGGVNESDMKLARSSDGVVLSFRVKPDKIAEALAQKDKIKNFNFDVIYTMAQKVRELMQKKLTAEKERIDLGEMDVLAIFRTEKERQIVGGKIIDGKLETGCNLEIYRDSALVGRGKVIELEVGKKKVGTASKGSECGILYKGKERIQEGDVLRFFKEEIVDNVI